MLTSCLRRVISSLTCNLRRLSSTTFKSSVDGWVNASLISCSNAWCLFSSSARCDSIAIRLPPCVLCSNPVRSNLVRTGNAMLYQRDQPPRYSLCRREKIPALHHFAGTDLDSRQNVAIRIGLGAATAFLSPQSCYIVASPTHERLGSPIDFGGTNRL